MPSREDIARCRILVVGDVMLDRYWFGSVNRISPEAPVPVVNIESETEKAGGAANVALNINALGAQVTLLSCVGCDEASVKLRFLMQDAGVDVLFQEDVTLQTMVKLRVVARQQQVLRIDFEKKPDHEVLVRMLADYKSQLSNHDVVVFSDYGKGGLTHIEKMIGIACSAGKKVLVDPKGIDFSRYSGATVITPNTAEMAAVVGHWLNEEDLHRRAEMLRNDLALNAILLTRSEMGMSLFEADEVSSVPAEVHEVSDVTGAGDTVVGTMAILVACGISCKEAMLHANRAGGLVVAKFGTATISYDELFN